ncbi:MAG: ribosome recycling factor [Melioribacteraceae bacterium]|jgi:ribosome recycling factor|nr:ribosome recycling factor [Melioribacteraceae bacterium]
MNEVIKEAKEKMDKTIEAFRQEVSKVRSGKATTALLDGIKVDYYGTPTPLNQVSNITVLDAHTLSITPWDKNMVNTIDRAILTADLGFNPLNDGTNIKIPVPQLTGERRIDLAKLAKKFGEEAKISLRNIRHQAIDKLKKMESEKELSEDLRHDGEADVQQITDNHSKTIDEMVVHKEKEIMEI